MAKEYGMLSENQTQSTSRTSTQKRVSNDIVELILEDHKPLKELIRILKDDEQDFEKRSEAMDQFAVALICHAKPEEEVLYEQIKKIKELRTEGYEGEVEHTLADQMVEEIRRTTDPDVWSAKVKVVAELVEHHIKEEESELLPDFQSYSEANMREQLGVQFLEAKTALLEQGGVDSPSERELDRKH